MFSRFSQPLCAHEYIFLWVCRENEIVPITLGHSGLASTTFWYLEKALWMFPLLLFLLQIDGWLQALSRSSLPWPQGRGRVSVCAGVHVSCFVQSDSEALQEVDFSLEKSTELLDCGRRKHQSTFRKQDCQSCLFMWYIRLNFVLVIV